MNTRTWWTVIIVLFVVIVVGLYILIAVPAPAHAPTTDTDDVASSDEPLHTRVIVTSVAPNDVVEKIFTVRGEAPGNWYFEADFPIWVYDKEGNVVGQGIATAQSDWMTTEQVPFVAEVTVTDYNGSAMLILQRDNPSGLPEYDDLFAIPIVIE